MVKSAKRLPQALRSPKPRPKPGAMFGEALQSGCFDAPFGKLTIIASASGIRSITLGHQPPGTPVIADQRSSSIRAHALVQQAQVQLGEYFARQRTAFTLPLDARGTEFQLLAWSALSRIPFGSTSSYSQVPCAGVCFS